LINGLSVAVIQSFKIFEENNGDFAGFTQKTNMFSLPLFKNKGQIG
jgi:hypothetical protein